MSTANAHGTSRAPSFVSIVNPLIRRLVGAGMPFGPNVLLTVRGRTSGVARTFPVAIVELDGRRFVQSPFGEVNWVRNLRAVGEGTLTTGRRAEAIRATELAHRFGPGRARVQRRARVHRKPSPRPRNVPLKRSRPARRSGAGERSG